MTSYWGPRLWYIIHCISYCYPDNPSNTDKAIYYRFYIIIANIIVCKKCKFHYMNYINKHLPTHLNSKNDLVDLFISLHNDINVDKKKQVMTRRVADTLYKDTHHVYILQLLNYCKKTVINKEITLASYCEFMHLLQYVLPCTKCKLNYISLLAKYPIQIYLCRPDCSIDCIHDWFKKCVIPVMSHSVS